MTLSCLYPMAKVKSIIFAMIPKVRTNTNINGPLIATKVVKLNRKWLKMPPNITYKLKFSQGSIPTDPLTYKPLSGVYERSYK